MDEKKNTAQMTELVRSRIALLHEVVPDSIGDLMHYQLLGCDVEKGEYILRCETREWMRNAAGTLHGGMCATVVDQAMGLIAFCIKPGEGIAPTVQLQVTYHRPLIPGEDVLIHVHVISTTKSLIHLSAEVYEAASPERLCLTSTGIYFYKPAEPRE